MTHKEICGWVGFSTLPVVFLIVVQVDSSIVSEIPETHLGLRALGSCMSQLHMLHLFYFLLPVILTTLKTSLYFSSLSLSPLLHGSHPMAAYSTLG